jgi:hypothetical protein
MSEAVLAYTVHHKGRKYSAGKSAAQIGPVASEIGDHAWVGGKGPGPVTGGGDPDASTRTGTPPDSMSALGTPPTPAETAENSVAGLQPATPAGTTEDSAGEQPDATSGAGKRSAPRRGGGTGG